MRSDVLSALTEISMASDGCPQLNELSSRCFLGVEGFCVSARGPSHQVARMKITGFFTGLGLPFNFWKAFNLSILQVLRNSIHREECIADSEAHLPSRCRLAPRHSNHSSCRSGLWCRHVGQRPREEFSRFVHR